MAYYSSPEEMFAKRAEKSRKIADLHWAKAKNGEGGHHYAQAKRCYDQAVSNQAKADRARVTGATWEKNKPKLITKEEMV